MQESKLDQIWADGLHQVRVVNAFGVRIVIQPVGFLTRSEERVERRAATEKSPDTISENSTVS
jgi:hypothetical protein